MNKVTRKMGKVVCSFALALAIFAMPTASMAVEAAGYTSLEGEMENVQAIVGDGCITFKWTWNPDFLANGYGDGSDAPLLSYYAGHDYNGAEAYVAYVSEDIVQNDDIVPEMGVNAWVVSIPTSTTTWTCTGLENGKEYAFTCYYDEETGEGKTLTPVAAPASNLTDDNTDNTPGVTPSEDDEENTTPVVTPTVDAEDNASEVAPSENTVVVSAEAEEEDGPSIFEAQLLEIEEEIMNAEDGTVVKLDGGKELNALPNCIMQTLYKKGTVSLEFSFEYDEQQYVVMIPAGKAKNADIPWYGHLYLLGNYGK